MAVYDNIIASILLVSFSIMTIVVGFTVYKDNLETISENAIYDKLYNTIENSISTMLVTTEPNYGIQFNRALASYFYYGSDTIETSYGDMSMNESIEPMLDYFLGDGRYYFEVYPVISDLRFHFIVDGSDSMVSMRNYLNHELPGFLSELREDKGFDVFATVYILTDNESLCDEFTVLGCETLGMDDLYGVVPNINDPYSSSQLSIDPLTYATSDWASAIAVVSHENNVHKDSKLELIIPIGDEVNLGSKDDSCYTLSNNDYYDSLELISCLFCNKIVNFDKSWETVKRIKPIVKENTHLICPMNAMRPYYEETSVVHDYLEAAFGTPPNDAVSSTFCGDSRCEACIDLNNCNAFDVCSIEGNCPGCGASTGSVAYWHPEAHDELNDQFWYLANMTGGKNFTITQFSEITAYIQQVVDDYINNRKFSLGEKLNSEYMAFHKILPNPYASDANMELRIKFYYDEIYNLSSSQIDIFPMLIDFNLLEVSSSNYHFNCTIRDDERIIKVMLMFDGKVDSHVSVVDFKSRVVDGKRIFYNFNLSFSDLDFLSSSYNLSLKVLEEDGDEYFIENFYIDFDGLGVCGCDTNILCQTGCSCDPDCSNLPSKFFWNNYAGDSWNDGSGIDYLTGVRDQGLCGSCWAFAIVGAIEGKHNIEQDLPGFNINLAEQDLISCASMGSPGLQGCNGAIPSLGGMFDAEQYTIEPGLRSEYVFPYQAADVGCIFGDYSHKVASWSYVPSLDDDEIRSYLVKYGPLVTFIHMDANTGGWLAKIDGTCNFPGSPDHAVLIVGYDNDGWIIRNSWGPINIYNHDSGYFKVQYGQCSINRNFYPDYPNDVQEI